MLFNYEFNGKSEWKTKYVIYLITNTISKKYYVGQTRREIRFRWNDYKNDLLKPIKIKKRKGCNVRLKRSVQKHFKQQGNTDFLKFSILEVVDVSNLTNEKEKQNLLNQREMHYIKEYRKLYGKSKVFNITDGGHRKSYTEKEKQEQSERIKLFFQTEEGKRQIEENRQFMIEFFETEKGLELKKQISERSKGKHYSPETEFKKGEVSGENNPFYGKTHSDETKKRLSEIQAGKTFEEKLGEEKGKLARQRLSTGMKKSYQTDKGQIRKENSRKRALGQNNPNAKTYDLSSNPLISPDGVVYKEIKCLAEFARNNNISKGSLLKLMQRKIKYSKGWHLLYT